MVNVRTARPEDAGALLEIYGPNVLTTAYTFETKIPSLKEFEARMEKCLQKYPWLVCEADGKLTGYVYASTHREREAYQWTCECSVYIHENYKGRGIGFGLYAGLFKILKRQGLVNVYAGITLPNDASASLHEKCGFVRFATYENIGYKLNSWHKVGWWKLRLNDYTEKPSPPLRFSELNTDQYATILEDATRSIQSKIIG